MSSSQSVAEIIDPHPVRTEQTIVNVLVAVSFCHLLNDMMQALIPSMYPILKTSFHLDFGHIGLITLAYQVTASLLQPIIGAYTDRHPLPYSLPAGMAFTFCGLLLLALAPNFELLVGASMLIGVGSAIFHPESSRVARLASGGRHGFAQSFFQVGGNTGAAIGPLLAAGIVLPHGQVGAAWFSLAALVGFFVLVRVSDWYGGYLHGVRARAASHPEAHSALPAGTIGRALAVLIALLFSKYFYLASFSSYYTFYLIERFHVSVRQSQIYLFVFLGAVAAGTLAGGPIGDRIGRRPVIWFSILGILPFSLALPYAPLYLTIALSAVIGLVIASAFSAILVYAQELMPGKVGTISGLFFGLAFGMGGIGAAVLGRIADHYGLAFTYQLCSYLPALGLLTGFLPDTRRARVGNTVARQG